MKNPAHLESSCILFYMRKTVGNLWSNLDIGYNFIVRSYYLDGSLCGDFLDDFILQNFAALIYRVPRFDKNIALGTEFFQFVLGHKKSHPCV